MLRYLMTNEDGIETVEVVIITAVLVGLALLFRKQLYELVQKVLGQLDSAVIDGNLTEPPK